MSYKLQYNDIDTAQKTLVRAFFNYPFPSLSIAEPRRMAALAILYREQLKFFLTRGSVEADSPECNGVVIWSTVGAAGSGAPAWKLVLKLLGKMKISEMIHLARNSASVEKGRNSLNLPADTLYLYVIGVRPGMQRKGVAAKLIAEKLAGCAGQTVYVETNTEHNCRYYQRIGFDLVKTTYYERNDLTTWYLVKYP